MSTQTLTIPIPVSTEVTPTQQAAWISLAQQKNYLNASLSKAELQAQAILISVKDSQDYKAIDAALIEYRKANAEMTESRKQFTNAIDTGIVQPLMAYEKRVKDSGEYAALVSRSLALRKAESDKANAANLKNQEKARFRAHVENEFHRVAAEYRGFLRRECAGQYEIALRAKLNGDTSDIKKMLQTLAVPAVNKFQTTLLSQEEKLELFATIPKPNYAEMYADACKDLDAMFANFDSDLANADAAIAEQKKQEQLTAIEEQKKLAEETAMTTLIATSETIVIDEPKIKRTLQVVVVESEQWVKSVCAAFIVNMPHLIKYVRVKKWSNLTVGQMAVALGQLASETGLQFSNLNLMEVEK